MMHTGLKMSEGEKDVGRHDPREEPILNDFMQKRQKMGKKDSKT